jgi:hypothetical protein
VQEPECDHRHEQCDNDTVVDGADTWPPLAGELTDLDGRV